MVLSSSRFTCIVEEKLQVQPVLLASGEKASDFAPRDASSPSPAGVQGTTEASRLKNTG